MAPERTTADIAATAATPWLLAPAWVLLAGALVARQRRLVVMAAVLAAFHAFCVRDRPRGTTSTVPGPDGPELRVAFANLWCYNNDVAGVLGELVGGEHDILAMAEVTEEHAAVIDALFPSSVYPWRRVEPDAYPGSTGLALVSRVPLSHVETWSTQGHPQFDAVVVVPEASALRLLVVHTWGPVGRLGCGLGLAARRGRARASTPGR